MRGPFEVSYRPRVLTEVGKLIRMAKSIGIYGRLCRWD